MVTSDNKWFNETDGGQALLRPYLRVDERSGWSDRRLIYR